MADSWCLKTRRRKENQSLKPGFQYFSTLINVGGRSMSLCKFILSMTKRALHTPIDFLIGISYIWEIRINKIENKTNQMVCLFVENSFIDNKTLNCLSRLWI